MNYIYYKYIYNVQYFVVSYPRGLLPKPFSKVYLDNICEVITKGIQSNEQYSDAKVHFITDYEGIFFFFL